MKVTIVDTAYGGNGVGKLENGKTVFIPYTVTGDIVEAELIEDKGSYHIARMLEIVTPSPYRREPHCKYHGECGGCQFGHIDYGYQLEIKKNILLQALRKHPQHGEIVKSINVVSGEIEGYRIRGTVRTFGGRAGFFKSGSNEFIAIDECPVFKASLFEKCANWAKEADDNILYSIAAIENPAGEAIALIEKSSAELGGGFAGISNGKKHEGIPHLVYETAFGAVPVAYGGFFQANRFLNDEFQRHATEGLDGKILELYAGSGFFTAALMAGGGAVQAIELNAQAAKLGRKYGYPVKAGDVATIAQNNEKYDAVFVDPPRDGIDKKTMAAILRLAPKKLRYVSCNPMTLARDLGRLSDAYKITDLTLFDLFAHSYHMETVVKLERLK